jgi:hypothetical protein
VRDRWRVAVLDSGLADPATTRLRADTAARVPGPAPVASCRFVDTGREVLKAPAIADPMGHGTAVCQVICGAARPVDLLIGQVLDHRAVATAAALAAAIGWSLDEGADLIHMSLGLRADRPVLAVAVERAVKAGCIVVASAPARGQGTFPAQYPHVIRATGDARCQPEEISALDSAQADFGGCPRHMRRGELVTTDSMRCGGASLGAAHLTRILVGRIAPGSEATAVRGQLRAMARYRGIECCLAQDNTRVLRC